MWRISTRRDEFPRASSRSMKTASGLLRVRPRHVRAERMPPKWVQAEKILRLLGREASERNCFGRAFQSALLVESRDGSAERLFPACRCAPCQLCSHPARNARVLKAYYCLRRAACSSNCCADPQAESDRGSIFTTSGAWKFHTVNPQG